MTRVTLVFAAGALVGAVSMLGGLILVAARLATDTHTDPRPGRDY